MDYIGVCLLVSGSVSVLSGDVSLVVCLCCQVMCHW